MVETDSAEETDNLDRGRSMPLLSKAREKSESLSLYVLVYERVIFSLLIQQSLLLEHPNCGSSIKENEVELWSPLELRKPLMIIDCS